MLGSIGRGGSAIVRSAIDALAESDIFAGSAAFGAACVSVVGSSAWGLEEPQPINFRALAAAARRA